MAILLVKKLLKTRYALKTKNWYNSFYHYGMFDVKRTLNPLALMQPRGGLSVLKYMRNNIFGEFFFASLLLFTGLKLSKSITRNGLFLSKSLSISFNNNSLPYNSKLATPEFSRLIFLFSKNVATNCFINWNLWLLLTASNNLCIFSMHFCAKKSCKTGKRHNILQVLWMD